MQFLLDNIKYSLLILKRKLNYDRDCFFLLNWKNYF